MEGNTGTGEGNNSTLVVDAQIHNPEDLQQPDDENQLPAIPAQGPGKTHAEQVLGV